MSRGWFKSLLWPRRRLGNPREHSSAGISNTNPWFFLAREHRLAYLQVPKVACTSLKIAVALLNRPDLRPEISAAPKQIHARLDWSDVVRGGNPVLDTLFRFTFIRDPIARFVSFYQSKIARPSRTRLAPEFEKAGFTLKMDFESALRVVEETPPEKLDPHILPQSCLVYESGRPRVEFIGRMERLAQDILAIEERIGVKLELGHFNRTQDLPGEAAAVILTPEQRARLVRIYVKDFELFGYSALSDC